MWGSRARGKKRRPGFGNHTFSNVKEGVKWATQRLRKQKRERVIKLKDAITKLTESGSKLTRRRGDIHKRMNIAREIGKLKVELADVMDDKPCEEFVERVQPLLTEDTQENRQQCHVLYLNLFHPDKSAPLFVERDICPTCNTEYVMAATESKMICPSCGDTDNLVHSNTEFVDEAEPTKPAPEYERGPVYRKYLMQYHEDAPCPSLVNNNAITMIPTRTAAYIFPRRLSYHEKTQRLQLVSLYTLDTIQSEELELTARRLQEAEAKGEEHHHHYDMMEWDTDLNHNDDIMTMGLDLDHSHFEENDDNDPTGWLWNDKILLQDVSNFNWSVFWGEEHPPVSA